MKKIITTKSAPAAIGPYSQAVQSGGLTYLSGQIALDPATGNLVDGGITAQTEQVLRNIRAVLAAADLTTADVVKTTIFLTNLADFAVVNELYGAVFAQEPPARSCVQVSALPKGAAVEIEVIALAH